MVDCIQCGKSLINECTCFTNDLDRIKEWKRLATREIDIIIEVLENDRPLLMRLINSTSITARATITPLKNGLRASCTFSLDELGVFRSTKIELLDWNHELIYFKPESGILEKSPSSESKLTMNWDLKINEGRETRNL